MYKLAWATHLSKEYGAPDFLIPKYSDPLNPQFYSNQELMEDEEVLNEFLVFPSETGKIKVHFWKVTFFHERDAYRDRPKIGVEIPSPKGERGLNPYSEIPRVHKFIEHQGRYYNERDGAEIIATIQTLSINTYQRFYLRYVIKDKVNNILLDVFTLMFTLVNKLTTLWDTYISMLECFHPFMFNRKGYRISKETHAWVIGFPSNVYKHFMATIRGADRSTSQAMILECQINFFWSFYHYNGVGHSRRTLPPLACLC